MLNFSYKSFDVSDFGQSISMKYNTEIHVTKKKKVDTLKRENAKQKKKKCKHDSNYSK